MTAITLILVVGTAVGFALTCVLLVPAMSRTFYSNSMYDIAGELDQALTEGKMPELSYPRRALDALYFLAENPKNASLVMMFHDGEVPELEIELEQFNRGSTSSQQKLLHKLVRRGAWLTGRQMVWNSIGWLPLYGLIRVTLLKRFVWDWLFGDRRKVAVTERDLMMAPVC